MVVLRRGGEYLGRRERRLWAWFVAASVATVACGIAAIFRLYEAFLAWPVAFLLARIGAGRLEHVRRGHVGERLVQRLLERLPDDYYLVNDVMLAGGAGNVEHVVVGPCGLVVIETKRLAGLIHCDGDRWYVNGYPRRSISRQVKRGAVAVKEFLAGAYPEVRTGWVESVVVFTHPLCRLQVRHARTTIVRYPELMGLMLALGQQCRMSPATARRIAETLAASQGPAPVPVPTA